MTHPTTDATTSHQAIAYCPYCGEETLFPEPAGAWQCRSCLRGFSVKFLGIGLPTAPAPEAGR